MRLSVSSFSGGIGTQVVGTIKIYSKKKNLIKEIQKKRHVLTAIEISVEFRHSKM